MFGRRALVISTLGASAPIELSLAWPRSGARHRSGMGSVVGTVLAPASPGLRWSRCSMLCQLSASADDGSSLAPRPVEDLAVPPRRTVRFPPVAHKTCDRAEWFRAARMPCAVGEVVGMHSITGTMVRRFALSAPSWVPLTPIGRTDSPAPLLRLSPSGRSAWCLPQTTSPMCCCINWLLAQPGRSARGARSLIGNTSPCSSSSLLLTRTAATRYGR